MSPTVGLALIVRDEEQTLPRLLASIEGAFDEVALVDTGSKDRTVEVFESWALAESDRHPDFRWYPSSFEWCEDFSAARAYADSLLTADFLVWADADDIVRGASNLRAVAAQAPPEVAAYVSDYDYARDEHGNCVCRLKRERLVRAGHGTWQGRVHEAQVIEGASTFIGPEVVEWVHHKQPTAALPMRNLRILRRWLKDEPQNPRVLAYLGTEELTRGRAKQAVSYFRRYLKLKTGWDEERAQVHRRAGLALMELGRHEEAIGLAFEALRLLPAWPDSYLTLAEAHFRLGEVAKAAEWAQDVLRRGVPQTLLIINPTDYTVAPRVVLAGSLAGLGRLDDAIAVAEEALTIQPGHPLLVAPHAKWLGIRKRESTASTFTGSAEVLMAHDEQLKALRVMESVPHYAIDHPRVVSLRSLLRERIDHLYDGAGYREHYVSGGTQPEDMVADENVLALGDALPRCGFLLQGLREQVAA